VIIATSLPARVLDTIRRHGMLRGGDRVLVAVSGGPDSVTLLDVLGWLRASLGFVVSVAHVHHDLRPEADDEAEVVCRLCERLGVACHVERVAVKRAPPWEGLEAEGRRARHGALERVARAVGASRIATGHTADDQAETVLMRLLQGAGPRGLGGIAPVRGLLISPLIESRRVEIIDHLRVRGLPWVEDASNRDARFLRNRIRHDLLPFMAERIGAPVVEALCRSAAAARALVAELSTAWPPAMPPASRWTSRRSRRARSSWGPRSCARPRRRWARLDRSAGPPSGPFARCSPGRLAGGRCGSAGSSPSEAAAACGWGRSRCPRCRRAHGLRRARSTCRRSDSA
jgi:tRNA(Ile)-lysidine synthetase-like protein